METAVYHRRNRPVFVLLCIRCEKFITGRYGQVPAACPKCGAEISLVDRAKAGCPAAIAEIRQAVDEAAASRYQLGKRQCGVCRKVVERDLAVCPVCGFSVFQLVRKEASEMATGTKAKKSTPAIKGKALANDQATWKCPECEHQNYAWEPFCACDWPRADLDPTLQQLAGALEPNDEASEHWEQLHKSGAADQEHLPDALHQLGTGEIGFAALRREVAPEPELPSERPAGLVGNGKPTSIGVGRITHGPKPAKKPAAAASNGPRAAIAGAMMLPTAMIRRGGNPREHFDEAKLEELAATIRAHGILQPLVVRPASEHGSHELIAGERRLRAAERAGLAEVPVVVRDLDDAAAAKCRIVENDCREALNAIERAKAYQVLVDRYGMTQQQLADEFGISQGQVANTLRLLKLPEEWRKRIISHEIPPTHARALLPWVDYPAVLSEAAEEIGKGSTADLTVDEFQEIVHEAVVTAGRPMNNSNTWNPTKKQEADLDVVTFRGPYGGNVRVAMNAARYDELKAAAAAKAQARQSKQLNAESESETPAKAKLSPAEQKKREKQKAEQFAKRLYRWKIAWLQGLVVERMATADYSLVLKALLHFAVVSARTRRYEELGDLIKGAGGKPPRSCVWISVSAVADVAALGRAAACEWLKHTFEGGYHADINPETIEAIANEMEIDVLREFRVTREFLELHTRDQLAKLAGEWKIIAIGEKRPAMIDSILAENTSRRLPAPVELLKLKPVSLL